MDALAAKSEALRSAIRELRVRLGSRTFDVVDWWADDPEVVGLARSGDDEPAVCLVSRGKAEGRFDVDARGRLHRDCAIEGVLWIVRSELERRGRCSPPRSFSRDPRRREAGR